MSTTTTKTKGKKKLVYRQDPDGVFRLKKVDDNESMLSGQTTTTVEKKQRVDNYLNELIECSYKVVETDEDEQPTDSNGHSHTTVPQVPAKLKPPKVFVAKQKKSLTKKNNKLSIPPLPKRRPSVSSLLSIKTEDLSEHDQKRIKEAIHLLKEREKSVQQKTKQAKEEQERLKEEERLKELKEQLEIEKEKEKQLLKELEKEKKKKKKAKVKVIQTEPEQTEQKPKETAIEDKRETPIAELPPLPKHNETSNSEISGPPAIPEHKDNKTEKKTSGSISNIMKQIKQASNSLTQFHTPSYIWGFLTPILLIKFAQPIMIIAAMLAGLGLVAGGLLWQFDRLGLMKGKNHYLDILINKLESSKKETHKKEESPKKNKTVESKNTSSKDTKKEAVVIMEESEEEEEEEGESSEEEDEMSETESETVKDESDGEVKTIDDEPSIDDTEYVEFIKQPVALPKRPSPESRHTDDPHTIRVAPFRYERRRSQNNSLPNLVTPVKTAPPLKRMHTAPTSRRVSTGSMSPVRQLPTIPAQNDEDLPLINEVRLYDDEEEEEEELPELPQKPSSGFLQRGMSTKSKHSILGTRDNYKRFLANVDGYD
ncbi:uncharacterized protein J8A68_001715 [[Candida] subhashii]|uniref:Uncharacterized protein n=1 Tax=[Candida] subhashii TaxID=561895 RepID=A0A8J5UZ70_9ASCO|nr:uncharacterized protein J8A68_001715 [[Candida] subhashii]KAG7664760.1 hypothetical protein J8A68_001715 [[Candida] subhashii]